MLQAGVASNAVPHRASEPRAVGQLRVVRGRQLLGSVGDEQRGELALEVVANDEGRGD